MRLLETQRLVLRPFTADDLADAQRVLYADPEVAIPWAGRTKTVDEIRASFAAKVAQGPDDFGFLAVVRKTDRQLIGTVALQRYLPGEDTGYIILESAPDYRVGGDPNFIEVELTYALGRAFWGQGFAAEAGQALLQRGFHAMGVRRIVNSVSSQNVRSINLMRRLGFRLKKNLHPRPSSISNAPGVVGILENDQLRAVGN